MLAPQQSRPAPAPAAEAAEPLRVRPGVLADTLNTAVAVQRLRAHSAVLNGNPAPVVQRARAVTAIFDLVDNNAAALGPVSGVEMQRLQYWNDTGVFDAPKQLDVKAAKKYRAKKIPLEEAAVDEGGLPEFMRLREQFGVNLPACFGGQKIWFRKRLDRRMMQGGAGWISDNVYYRAPPPAQAGDHPPPRPRYMIHAILGFQDGAAEAPNPHITLRNAATQVAIDLDISHPRVQAVGPRIVGALEVTHSSYSRGLGGDREPGANMVQDDRAFADLEGDDVRGWLERLRDAAQAARLAAG